MNRVVIFDLLLAKCTFHTTPRPTMLAMLISGWHKSQGDNVLLTDEAPNFQLYDLIYILKDAPELPHDPQWLKHQNVVLVGDHWSIPVEWNDEWEEALPDQYLYQGWATNWMKRYPSISSARMESFFRKPVKIKQGNRLVIPEGNNLLIIDKHMEQWDKDGKIISSVPMKQGWLLYPMQLEGRWEAVLDVFSQRHIKRRNFWAEFNSTISQEEMELAVELLNEHKPGRMFRIKMHSWAGSHKEWCRELENSYNILAYFRNNAEKRLWCEPHYIETFNYPRILTELKRWTAMNAGYNKNSLFSYIVYDGCRNIESMAKFFADPYLYLEQKKQGSNKFKELVPFMENEPELMDVITTSYPKAGY